MAANTIIYKYICNFEEERARFFTFIVFLLTASVLCLFLVVPWVGLLSMIAAFYGHTHMLFETFTCQLLIWASYSFNIC